MALPTYLELVNEVLVRMREPEVGSVNENALSKVIGKYINDGKRQVEDAYNWNALSYTIDIITSPAAFNYILAGSGSRFKILEVYNRTTREEMYPKTTHQMTRLYQQEDTPTTGSPRYFNFNGIDANGDTQVDLFPIPDDLYQLLFNVYLPQDALKNDTDKMIVPAEPVVAWAYARALVERGEDGGLPSSEAYALYKQVLADYIAIEASRYFEEETWEAT